MLSENKTVQKLEEYGEMFNDAAHRKDWGVAHNLYNMAHTVAVFMELGDEQLKRLFGDWDSDDGTETNTAEDEGVFRRSLVNEVNWKCCIERHQSYEDVACRREKRATLEFYSDEGYCAKCQGKKRAVPNWWDGPRR